SFYLVFWVFSRCDGWLLRSQRPAACDFWNCAGLVATAVSRYNSGLFSSGEFTWNGRLLSFRSLDIRSEYLVCLFLTSHFFRNFLWGGFDTHNGPRTLCALS